MKKNLFIRLCLLPLLFAMVALIPACKKNNDSGAAPVITGVRLYKASPADSVLKSVQPQGQYVVLEGRHLKNAVLITFDGVRLPFNIALFSDTSAVVQIPSVIPYDNVPASDLNTIKYTTTAGSTTFKYNIIIPPPDITGISNEDAAVGDSVKIYGVNFFLIKSLTYAGITIPANGYSHSTDGTIISLAVPPGISQTGGVVSVTTKSGVATTTYNVEDFVDGVFQNWDNINGYPWGCGSSNSSTDYPGNTNWYGVFSASNMAAHDGSWWAHPGVNMGSNQWVPASDISNSPTNYAVKFEISVPASTPWTNGSIFVAVNYSFNYIALYRPWAKDGSFTTTGWQTVTIPLSTFRPNNGTGDPGVASISALVGASGNNGMNIWFMNDGDTPVTSFKAAIDNIRVVKIK